MCVDYRIISEIDVEAIIDKGEMKYVVMFY